MTQSRRFEIGSAFVAALIAAPALAGVKVRRNPREPSTTKDGNRVIFLEEDSDGYVDGKGQQDKRLYAFTVGVINRGDDPEAGADADQMAAGAALREAGYVLARDGSTTQLRETQTVFKVEGVDVVGGALILTTYQIEYREPKTARTPPPTS